MTDPQQRPRIAIFAPDLLLSVTIESRDSRDELHLHPAGQGVWVARMAAELGSHPVLCSFLGGETGTLLRGLIAALPAELRAAPTAANSGSYVTDRRTGRREPLALAPRAAPARHEIDDLLAVTVAAALGTKLLVVCNPYPAVGFPEEAYETLVGAVAAAGVPVLVDLSSPRLERTLAHGPALVKLDDWELAAYVRGPVDGSRLLAAARRLRDEGARTVVVTRAEAPILVLPEDDEPFEVVPPRFPVGHREGCGDTMMGAIAAGWAGGLTLREALRQGAAAGSANFLRHGLGTGRRAVVQEMTARIVVQPLHDAALKAPAPVPRTAA